MINTNRWKIIIRSFGVFLLLVLLMGVAEVAADSDPIGSSEYRISCQSCHGIGGKGDGPIAEFLKVQPKDLTRIAINNQGIFPLDQVFRIIDGRHGVTGHGERDMPIWGARYLKEDADKYGSMGGEGVVRLRILELVYYIHSIQQY